MRLLAATALCLALAGCQVGKPGLLHIDPALESLAPADSVFVAGANVEAIRDTPVYQRLLSRVPLPQLQEFTDKTGLDPRKDLSQILSCSNGKRGLLMARGKFDVPAIEARLQASVAAPVTYKNHRLFGDERASIVFLNSSTAVAGPAPDLRAAIDRGRSGGGLPVALRDLLRTLPPGDQIYAALTGGLAGLNLPVPENSNLATLLQVMRSVDTATLGMDLSSGLHLKADVNCKTERDAKFVHDMVRGVVGFGRLNTPDNHPELLKLYDAIQVTQLQTRADVSADIPQDLADKFLDMWLKR
ncbi:MAG: hypothetical protein ABSB86_15850 [Bryobacteraceae bacterium]|jgi:hypothetical protein